MLSMTGYGKAEYKDKDFDILVEIRSVNNKNLDISVKQPRVFLSMEDAVRKVVRQTVQRGHVDVFVNFNDLREAEGSIALDKQLAADYLRIAKQLNNELSVRGELSISELIRFPDVIKTSADFSDYSFLGDILSATVLKACERLNAMRSLEGEKLYDDFVLRINTIRNLVDEIKKVAPSVTENYTAKLKERITQYLGDVAYDEAKLLNEVAFFSDKVNIDEEITRLYSHISQFTQLIETENCGKKLDFLVQEFNRESNTICSKSNDVTITDTALLLKCEIEKIREQIQNIE